MIYCNTGRNWFSHLGSVFQSHNVADGSETLLTEKSCVLLSVLQGKKRDECFSLFASPGTAEIVSFYVLLGVRGCMIIDSLCFV